MIKDKCFCWFISAREIIHEMIKKETAYYHYTSPWLLSPSWILWILIPDFLLCIWKSVVRLHLQNISMLVVHCPRGLEVRIKYKKIFKFKWRKKSLKIACTKDPCVYVIDHYHIMDLLTCIFILLILTILGLFIRFLVSLYKDRGRLAFQVIDGT